MIDFWFVLAVFAGLASSIMNILSRYALRGGRDATTFGWIYEVTRFLVFAVVIFWDFSISLSVRAILILACLSVVEFISVYLFMKMHAFADLSLSTIIHRSRTIWVAILAFFILGERLSMFEYGAIAILFFGVVFIAAPHKIRWDKGVKLAFLSAIVVAILNILMKEATSLGSVSVVMFSMSLVSIFAIPLLMKDPISRLKEAFRTNFHFSILAALANALSMLLYVLALKLSSVSKVTAIYQSMIIVSVFVGIFGLAERKHTGRKLIGTAITVIGIILLAL